MTLPTCPIVDSHHHLGRRPGGEEFSGGDLVRRMDRAGIAHSLAIHFVSQLRSPDAFRRANAYVAEQVDRYPSRLSGAVVVGPALGAATGQEVERYHRLGFRAIKLHPIFHGHYHVNGGAVDEVIELAGIVGMPVVIHSDFLSPVCSPYEIVALAQRFPATTIVMLHMGLQPELCRLTPGIVAGVDNVVLDTSQTPDFPRHVYVDPVRRLGPDRLMFGSDGPDCDVVVNLRKLEVALDEHGLTAEEARCILSTNAMRLFNIQVPE